MPGLSFTASSNPTHTLAIIATPGSPVCMLMRCPHAFLGAAGAWLGLKRTPTSAV